MCRWGIVFQYRTHTSVISSSSGRAPDIPQGQRVDSGGSYQLNFFRRARGFLACCWVNRVRRPCGRSPRRHHPGRGGLPLGHEGDLRRGREGTSGGHQPSSHSPSPSMLASIDRVPPVLPFFSWMFFVWARLQSDVFGWRRGDSEMIEGGRTVVLLLCFAASALAAGLVTYWTSTGVYPYSM